MLFGLLPLIVLAGIAYAVVAAIKRRADAAGGGGSDVGVGRGFRYVLLLAAAIISAIGMTGLLGMVLSPADARRGEVAVPLAMTIVALPAFVLLGRWIWRALQADARERVSLTWPLYLNTALVIALAVTIGNAFTVAERLISADWESVAFAGFVVWGGLWASHWWLWRHARPEIGANVHLWLGSAIGLWVGAFSAGATVSLAVSRVLEATSSVVAMGEGNDLSLAASGVVIGGLVWGWHWWRHGLSAERTAGWYVYVLLFGVFAGLVASVSAAGYGLYLVLEWIWGDPGTTSAATQFGDLAVPIGSVVVGLGVWAYHRTLVSGAAPAVRTEVHRTYDYLVSAVALGTVATALVILVVAFFTVITPVSAVGGEGDGSINTLVAAVTLLAVGAPMWTVTWLRVQRTSAGNDEETGAPSRRRYLFAIFGVSGLVAFGALITFLIDVFEAILGERSGGAALAEDVDLPVALLLTAGAISAYHWIVYRAERHVEVRIPTRDVLLVCDGHPAIDDLAARTHTRIRVLHRTDLPEGTPVDADAIAAAIEHTAGEHLLVVSGPEGVTVVPYE